jgi:hypothetical protein
MNPEQRTMTIWGGGLAAGVIIGWIIVGGVRGPLLEERHNVAEGLFKSYSDLYPEKGMAVDEATKKWKTVFEHQQSALKDAEASLVPPLPPKYTNTDLSTGAAQVHADLQYLKQKAQRQKVTIPGTLPFEEGLDADEKQRLLQLAQLYLYRNAIDTCMDAGVDRIGSVRVEKEKGSTDAGGRYAVLVCQLELEVTWEKASQVLLDLIQAQNTKGFGVRALSLVHDRSGNERLSLTISLLTANNPAWGLRPDTGPVAPKGGGTGASGGGGRFGGKLGGG